MKQVRVKRVLVRHPFYTVVETEDGHRMILTDNDGPLSSYANIQTSQVLHHRLEQLERVGALSGIEKDVLDEALKVYRNTLFDRMTGQEAT